MASRDLQLEESEYISSLDTYFANFSNLATNEKYSNLYKTLPLDEPAFEIDANTRIITVPDVFRRNGISVQGDQSAEIIYFIVDRFFDTVDLYSTTPIIQWETTFNKTTQTGISPILYKDAQIYANENKMIFAWAINNTITKSAGSIKFAVRFYKVDNNNQLQFSLSTLTATATINPSLDFEYNATNGSFNSQILTDDRNLIQQRYLWDVEVITPSTAAKPEFTQNIINHPTDCIDHITEDGIEFHIIDLIDGEYKFSVLATASNIGRLTYTWQKKIGNSDWVVAGEDNLEYKLVSSDTTLSTSFTYYKKDTGVYYPYVIPSDGSVVTAADVGEDLYTALHTFTAKAVGNYRVVVSNIRGAVPAKTESEIVRIPGPSDFELNDNDTQLILNENDSAIIEVKATVGNERDTFSYAWSKKNEENEYDAIENTSNTYTVAVADLTDETRAKVDENYRVNISANRNGEATEPKIIDYRITDKAHAFASAPLDVTEKMLKSGKTFDVHVLLNAVINDQVCDNVKYQWFKAVLSDEEDTNTDYNNDTPMTEVIEVSKDNVATIKYTVSTVGNFYCKLINIVNGTESDPTYSEYCKVSSAG